MDAELQRSSHLDELMILLCSISFCLGVLELERRPSPPRRCGIVHLHKLAGERAGFPLVQTVHSGDRNQHAHRTRSLEFASMTDSTG